MERIYIDGDTERFTRKGMTCVDVELSDGRILENLEPRRLFPISNMHQYIALLDEEGTEQAVIRDVKALHPEQQRVINACLQEYYLVPVIQRITDCDERFDGITLHVETDRGSAIIHIRILRQGLKQTADGRVLVRDVNDNRYEIPNLAKLDAHSRQILWRYM